MFTKKVLVSALFAAGMLGAGAMPQTSIAAIDVYVNVAPPAERYERVPEVRRGYVWSPGYWDWRHDKHVWVKGSSVRERQGYAYEPNRWVQRDGRWNLERSRWNQAHRDSDHDGVPNRRDPTPYGGKRAGDRDHDGVPNNRDSHPDNPNRR
jgi:hypothetical protein